MSGTLAPTVVLTHAKNVLFKLEGNGVSSDRGIGALVFDSGMLEGNAAVLLYPSSPSANVDAR